MKEILHICRLKRFPFSYDLFSYLENYTKGALNYFFYYISSLIVFFWKKLEQVTWEGMF